MRTAADLFRGTGSGPCGLYLHVPFCRGKCPYCSFYSRPLTARALDEYLTGVERELGILASRYSGKLQTVYIGGGTPSALPIDAWRRLFAGLEWLKRESSAEFTAEANPESLTDELIGLWQDHGVNRVSLGVQSLDDRILSGLSRHHSAVQALERTAQCVRLGFRVSCDVMFGLPGQTLRNFAETVKRLVSTGVRHLSLYQLSIEPGSYWWAHRPKELGGGYASYRWAQWYLPRQGFRQYEIASFAGPGEESRHNQLYWTRANVLPAGPSAWGYWEGCRTCGEPTVGRWAADLAAGRLPLAGWEELKGGRAASEAVILGTRMAQGIDLASWESQFGRRARGELERRLSLLPPDCFAVRAGRLSLTPKGMRLGNALWSELLEL